MPEIMTPARQEAERLAGEALPCNSHLGHRHLKFHPEDCPAFYIPAVADLLEPLLAGRYDDKTV